VSIFWGERGFDLLGEEAIVMVALVFLFVDFMCIESFGG
jgi:hypothetical protein